MTIDAYAHVGLPRFLSVADYERVMAAAGIRKAVLCSFDSSPDLAAIHAAITTSPDRFRGIGVPLGASRSEMEAGVRAQLGAGFSGLRLTDADVTERSWLLDILAEHSGVAVIAGHAASEASARALVAALDRHPSLVAVGVHFAGVGDPSQLAAGPAADLFSHPRFHVVFSRQGAHGAGAVLAWAEAIVARTGWSRLMWGSEVPVLFWRNETVPEALDWVNALGPSSAEKAAFHSGNAEALYFGAVVRTGALTLPFDPFDHIKPIPATMWARTLPVDQAVAGRLVHAWLADGGRGSLGRYLEALLDRTLPQ